MTLFTVKQVAEILGVSKGCVYALIDAGKLDHHRIGLGRGTIRISDQELDAYLDESRVTKETPLLKHLRL